MLRIPERLAAREGDEITFKVENLAGAGYLWEADMSAADAGGRIIAGFVEWRSEPGDPLGPIGGPTLATGVLRAVCAGEATLRLRCKRPWEAEVAREHSIEIVVRKTPNPPEVGMDAPILDVAALVRWLDAAAERAEPGSSIGVSQLELAKLASLRPPGLTFESGPPWFRWREIPLVAE